MAKIKIEKSTKRVLTRITNDYMRSRLMFTSLDITNQAKQAGVRIRNFQVADWMRRNVIALSNEQGSFYNQQLISVDSKVAGMTMAYLYLPHTFDPDDYLDRDQNPKSYQKKDKNVNSKVKDSASDVKSQTTIVPSNSSWKTQKRDAKGRWV